MLSAHELPYLQVWGSFQHEIFFWGENGALLFAFVDPKSIGRGAGQAHTELPPPQIKAWYLSILWVLLVLRERMMLNSWHDAQLLPSQLLTLTEQVRAGDKYRQTTKPT